jgi:predicted nucleic acid-binding protein
LKEYVLDANALVRFFRRTPGFIIVRGLIQQAKEGRAHLAMSVVNLGESFYVLARYFGKDEAMKFIESARDAVALISIGEKQALDAAMMRFHYKLGLADCFAAELAMRLKATLVTADPEFAKLGKQVKILALPRHSG